MKCAALAFLVLLVGAGCEPAQKRGVDRQSSPTTAGALPTSQQRYGTITGRYYADGGPPPLGYRPPQPIIGTITVTNERSHDTYSADQDSGGYFTLSVPVGTYEVTARSPNVAGAMTRTVTVTAGETVYADFGIHMA